MVGPPAQAIQESRSSGARVSSSQARKVLFDPLEPEKDSGGLIWEASPFPPVVGSVSQAPAGTNKKLPGSGKLQLGLCQAGLSSGLHISPHGF